MGKKLGILIIALAVLAIGVYAYNKKTAKAPANQDEITGTNPQNQTTPTPAPATSTQDKTAPAPTPPPAKGTFSNGEETDGNDIQVKEIIYDGKAYTPNSVDIKTGDYVIFRNNSNTDFWPASAPHPVHTDYPEFDARAPIPAGGKYQFQFMKAGNWKFHDHLNPSAHGVVNVTAK